MANNKYDIFISYRREGGAQYARILQLMLIQRGYKVFLDYDELTDGVFSDKIIAAIKDAPVFILVLSKGSMERCANDGDWVCKEIMLAVEMRKHIIPVNPDNDFNGFPDAMPENLKVAIGIQQYSEISFGQALGVTTDLLIKNRLVPTLGARNSEGRRDEDMTAAQETLRTQDAHNRFMKRVGVANAVAVLALVLCTCLWFWQRQRNIDESQAQSDARSAMRTELQEKYRSFQLQLNSDLSSSQMAAIDTLLTNMTEVYPDSIWMSQFEFSIGQWYGIQDEPFEVAQAHIPVTHISFAQITMFLMELNKQTKLFFALPDADLWEYAAHGGANRETTLYAGDDDVNKVSWYKDNSGGKAHPSDGQQGKDPNLLDLYDMSGNVAEMCNTPFNDSGLYTVCGGDYDSPASDVAVSSRKGIDTNAKDNHIGFRIILCKRN